MSLLHDGACRWRGCCRTWRRCGGMGESAPGTSGTIIARLLLISTHVRSGGGREIIRLLAASPPFLSSSLPSSCPHLIS
eukprot:755547-Hanusia_phi.AAC.5